MNKYLYPYYNEVTGECTIKSIMARSFDDAKAKILKRYFDLYSELESDDWSSFLCEIYDIFGIVIGEVYDIEEL